VKNHQKQNAQKKQSKHLNNYPSVYGFRGRFVLSRILTNSCHSILTVRIHSGIVVDSLDCFLLSGRVWGLGICFKCMRL